MFLISAEGFDGLKSIYDKSAGESNAKARARPPDARLGGGFGLTIALNL